MTSHMSVQGCSYIYAKMQHIWNKNMGRFCHSSDGFLMLCVHNLCVEPILISLNPILTEFMRMLVPPPNRHP